MAEIYIDDPRFDGWETVHTFTDAATAQAFVQQLLDLGVDAALTADNKPDRFGRGDVYLCVPVEQAGKAQELVEWPADED